MSGRFSGYQASPSHVGSTSFPTPSSRFAVRYVHGFCLMLPSDTPISGNALALLASSFRPVTADHRVPGYAWNGGLCVMPGTRSSFRQDAGIQGQGRQRRCWGTEGRVVLRTRRRSGRRAPDPCVAPRSGCDERGGAARSQALPTIALPCTLSPSRPLALSLPRSSVGVSGGGWRRDALSRAQTKCQAAAYPPWRWVPASCRDDGSISSVRQSLPRTCSGEAGILGPCGLSRALGFSYPSWAAA